MRYIINNYLLLYKQLYYCNPNIHRFKEIIPHYTYSECLVTLIAYVVEEGVVTGISILYAKVSVICVLIISAVIEVVGLYYMLSILVLLIVTITHGPYDEYTLVSVEL